MDHIANAVYRSVKALAPNENLHEWELPISLNSEIKLYNKPLDFGSSSSNPPPNKPVFSISMPKATMLLVENLFVNYKYKNSEAFELCEPNERIIVLETVINNKKVFKPENFDFASYKKNKKKKPDVKLREGFGSQISFWIRNPMNADQIYKVKVFNGNEAGGKVQIPGVTNKTTIIEVFNYLANYLNQMFAKKSQYVPIPPVTLETLKELGESRKCHLIIPAELTLDFAEIRNALREIRARQRKSIEHPEINPLYQIIWPIHNVSGQPFQKECKFSIYNPILNGKKGNRIPATNIEFNSIKKEFNGIYYHSIIFSGKAEDRHINYAYRFLWEFLSCYQNKIFYKKNSEFDKVDIELFKEIQKLEDTCRREAVELALLNQII